MIWTSTLLENKKTQLFLSQRHIMTPNFTIFYGMRLNKIFSVWFSSALNSATLIFASIGPANGLTK